MAYTHNAFIVIITSHLITIVINHDSFQCLTIRVYYNTFLTGQFGPQQSHEFEVPHYFVRIMGL